MKVRLISLVALAMTATAGVANAQVDPATDDYTPMTRSERLKHYLVSTFGRKAIANGAMRAEIGQLTNEPREFGQGPAGYGARFGSAFAQHIIRGTLHYGASAVLHQDDRYIRSTRTGFWSRAKYALVNTFVARRDNGHRTFAYARVGSAGGAAFIARTWLPRSVATASAGASSFGLTIAYDVGSNMLREFWPDIRHRFRRN